MRFIAIVWAVALSFHALAMGMPRLVDVAFRKGVIAPELALPGVTPACPPDGLAQPPATVEPTMARASSWLLGFSVGLEAGVRNGSGPLGTAENLSRLHAERAPIAAALGVHSPTLPPLIHAADALHEFQIFLQADPDCIATHLSRTYGPATGAVFQFAAAAGYAFVIRTQVPQLGSPFVPQLEVYGGRAGLTREQWAPLVADLSSVAPEEARRKVGEAVEAVQRVLAPGSPAHQ